MLSKLSDSGKLGIVATKSFLKALYSVRTKGKALNQSILPETLIELPPKDNILKFICIFNKTEIAETQTLLDRRMDFYFN